VEDRRPRLSGQARRLSSTGRRTQNIPVRPSPTFHSIDSSARTRRHRPVWRRRSALPAQTGNAIRNTRTDTRTNDGTL